MGSELKPCPNPECKGGLVRLTSDEDWWWVGCTGCWLSGPDGGSEDAAARLWNSLPRPSPAPSAPPGNAMQEIEAAEYFGCCTGDCPHESNQECVAAMTFEMERISELARIAMTSAPSALAEVREALEFYSYRENWTQIQDEDDHQPPVYYDEGKRALSALTSLEAEPQENSEPEELSCEDARLRHGHPEDPSGHPNPDAPVRPPAPERSKLSGPNALQGALQELELGLAHAISLIERGSPHIACQSMRRLHGITADCLAAEPASGVGEAAYRCLVAEIGDEARLLHGARMSGKERAHCAHRLHKIAAALASLGEPGAEEGS